MDQSTQTVRSDTLVYKPCVNMLEYEWQRKLEIDAAANASERYQRMLVNRQPYVTTFDTCITGRMPNHRECERCEDRMRNEAFYELYDGNAIDVGMSEVWQFFKSTHARNIIATLKHQADRTGTPVNQVRIRESLEDVEPIMIGSSDSDDSDYRPPRDPRVPLDDQGHLRPLDARERREHNAAVELRQQIRVARRQQQSRQKAGAKKPKLNAIL